MEYFMDLLYPSICQWTFSLFPCLGYYIAMNIAGAYIFLNYSFVWIYAQKWDDWIIW